ncbi:ATP-binding protein [Streptomyces xinghaiensis]|uniref:ATP-binding protein n=1 Tax=Streptomyces xinghaiensis TaxID=1038928 RepID=UPI0002FC8C1E|nr:ATP-binding protein [Streptomyces xinghaiensis]MZE79848.1 ATP-binding protein [Streptomyces sp. SID5475]
MVVVESSRASTADARHAAAEFVSSACPGVDADAVVLVVSELVANAARHTAGWWRLRLGARNDALIIDVEDRSEVPPAIRPTSDLTGGGGLGLIMVQRLSDELEVLPRPGGKTVRARFPLYAKAPA